MRDFLRRVVAAFESLSPSERLLVSIAAGLAVAVMLWIFPVRELLAASTGAGERVENAEKQLQAVEALRGRYDQVNARLAAVERRIRSGPPGEIFTTLERLARLSAVTVASMEPRTAPTSDNYKETKVQVSLKGVTLAQVVDYLYRIESAPQLLSIKSLRIRTRADKPDLLDVTFTVSSFEPVHS